MLTSTYAGVPSTSRSTRRAMTSLSSTSAARPSRSSVPWRSTSVSSSPVVLIPRTRPLRPSRARVRERSGRGDRPRGDLPADPDARPPPEPESRKRRAASPSVSPGSPSRRRSRARPNARAGSPRPASPGAILITRVCGKARSTVTPATAGSSWSTPSTCPASIGHEAPPHQVARRTRDLAGERRRRAAHVDPFEREDRGRVGGPVGEPDRDEGAERREEPAAGGDETREIQASTGRTSRKRDDDACRSNVPARSARASSPGHAA